MSKHRGHRAFYHLRAPSTPGAPPGTIKAHPRAHETVVDMFAYGPASFEEHANADAELAETLLEKWPVTWVNVDGLRNTAAIHRIAEIFDLHHLVLEDAVNTHQRAKVEQYGDQLFIVTRMVTLQPDTEIETEQLSIVLGSKFVVTFQERPGDTLGAVRERIRHGTTLRRFGADYLAYTIIDAVIDNYFPVLEIYGERLEELEEEVLVHPDQQSLEKVHKSRRDLLLLRRSIWPQRDALASLYRETLPQIADGTRVYLRDCHDHAVQVMDLVESYREMSAALIEVHISQTSNRLNEIVKVLTIFAAVFSPLTFIVGIWGMNFDPAASPLNMPELEWYWGYPFSLAVMTMVALMTLAYFRHKRWIGDGAARRRRRQSAKAKTT